MPTSLRLSASSSSGFTSTEIQSSPIWKIIGPLVETVFAGVVEGEDEPVSGSMEVAGQ